MITSEWAMDSVEGRIKQKRYVRAAFDCTSHAYTRISLTARLDRSFIYTMRRTQRCIYPTPDLRGG
jgi:hypothetical protein